MTYLLFGLAVVYETLEPGAEHGEAVDGAERREAFGAVVRDTGAKRAEHAALSSVAPPETVFRSPS